PPRSAARIDPPPRGEGWVAGIVNRSLLEGEIAKLQQRLFTQETRMGAQKGKDLLLKIDQDGLGNFITVAGLRTRRLAFNSETVDVTDSASAGRWRELLAGGGVQRASISGSGIFKGAQSDDRIRACFFAGEIVAWQLAIPDFGTVEG